MVDPAENLNVESVEGAHSDADLIDCGIETKITNEDVHETPSMDTSGGTLSHDKSTSSNDSTEADISTPDSEKDKKAQERVAKKAVERTKLLERWFGPDGIAVLQKASSTVTREPLQVVVPRLEKPIAEPAQDKTAETLEPMRNEPVVFSGKTARRGNLLLPVEDVKNKNLKFRFLTILNIDELNEMTLLGAQQFSFSPSRAVFEENGSISFNGTLYKGTTAMTSVVNQLLIAYRFAQLDLETLFQNCEFDAIYDSLQERAYGLEKLHDLLLGMKQKRIVIYNPKTKNGLSLLPMIFEDKRTNP